MKKLLILVYALTAMLTANSQNFTVKGKLSGLNIPADISLEYSGKVLKQVSNNGTFEFKGSGRPADALLKVIPHHPTLTMLDTAFWSWVKPNMHLMGARSFFLEGDVTIKGETINDVMVEGEKQAVYEGFRAREDALKRSLDSIRGMERGNESNDEDDENAEETVERAPSAAEKQLLKQISDLKLRFVEQHPDSYFSLNLTGEQSNGDVPTFNRMLDLLSERMRKTPVYAGLKSMSAGFSMKKIGNAAKNFTLNTAEGTPVSLASYKGKYVLVDFWASWCGPCRAENPNVLRAYNQFKSRNFEVLSISVDAKKEEWIKAVKEDKLPWTQVLDLKGNNSTATAYAVTGIPDNVLVDPNGIIIATNLRGKQLEKTLEKMLK